MTLSTTLDFIASLAILALLAESYGTLRRRLVGDLAAPVVIGALFGVMAVLQMYRPFSPADGLIVDMRNVPIALAGAFLGWRGLLPCLAIAVGARLGFGGVGTTAGIAAMGIAGLAGIIWARKVANQAKGTFSMLLCLALAMSTHLLAAVVLPDDLALWFFTTAAAPVLALNMLAIPVIGALLAREHARIEQENRVQRALSTDPVSGLLTGPAFVREVTSAFAAHPFGTFAGLIAVTPKRTLWHRMMGQRGVSQGRLVTIRDAAAQMLDHSDLAGFAADGSVYIPLTEAEVAKAGSLSNAMSKAISDRNATPRRFTITPFFYDLTVLSTEDPAAFLRLTERAAMSAEPDWMHRLKRRGNAPTARSRTPLPRTRIYDASKHDSLFAKADYLMTRGN